MSEQDADFSAMLITLFKGVLYKDQNPRYWQVLEDHQARVRDHVAVLGLELMLDEAEGHACLRQRTPPRTSRSCPGWCRAASSATR